MDATTHGEDGCVCVWGGGGGGGGGDPSYSLNSLYCISSVIRHFSSQNNPKNLDLKRSQKSRSILQDGSRSLGFRKGNTSIIAKLHRNLVICSLERGNSILQLNKKRHISNL